MMKFKPQMIRIPKDPGMAISKLTTFDLGGVIIELDTYKAAHTPQPIIVSIPQDKVVYAGDILYAGRLLAIVPGGNISQWIETFDYLKKFKDATFIPGHGEPAALSVFEKTTRNYLVMLENHMKRMVDDGVDMQDAINRLDQSAYSHMHDFKMLAGRNANLAYQEYERASFE